MKKVLSILRIGLGIIISVPIFLIVCIGYLLFVPFDIIRYHKMPYYKDFKIKYRFFITSSDIVQLYNRIILKRLPIEYIRYNNYEYFIKDGQILLCGWGNEDYEQIDNEWVFHLDDDCGDTTTQAMEQALAEEKVLLKPEHKDLPAKFLIFYNDITDAEKFEQAKKCPYFHCVFSIDEDI
ncbi:MAG: hypothetical protein IKK55_03385 [Clostridia bacterium]|nr:hypothetical protein [Clostridia bacterium]